MHLHSQMTGINGQGAKLSFFLNHVTRISNLMGRTPLLWGGGLQGSVQKKRKKKTEGTFVVQINLREGHLWPAQRCSTQPILLHWYLGLYT